MSTFHTFLWLDNGLPNGQMYRTFGERVARNLGLHLPDKGLDLFTIQDIIRHTLATFMPNILQDHEERGVLFC